MDHANLPQSDAGSYGIFLQRPIAPAMFLGVTALRQGCAVQRSGSRRSIGRSQADSGG